MTLYTPRGAAAARPQAAASAPQAAATTPAAPAAPARLAIRRPAVVIYTDGACKGNPGPGGWGAWLATADGHDKELCGGEALTTNNRMELTAVIEALASLRRTCDVTLHTDSEYVRKGITEWIQGWKQRGWKTADRKPVKNADLWQRLDGLRTLHAVDWRWVKGHAGDPGNERADALANRGAAAFVRGAAGRRTAA